LNAGSVNCGRRPGDLGHCSSFLLATDFRRASAADEVELVAFCVGEGHPAAAVLLDVSDRDGAQTGQSADFGVPVGGGQVKVQPVLLVWKAAWWPPEVN
jgi:hypothetical protein